MHVPGKFNRKAIQEHPAPDVVSPAITKPTVKPRLPDGVRIYAISDIHGCANLLEQMLGDADVAHSGPRHAIEVYLGEYISTADRTRSRRLTS